MQGFHEVPDFVRAGAVLIIDLDAIRDNYRILKRALNGVPCAGVVKADGYGLGAGRIAEALAHEGCDRFFVAHLTEGIDLRAHLGPAPRIYILNGLPPGAESDAEGHGVIPVLNSLEQMRAWAAIAWNRDRRLPAAIQIDSGMSRLGMQPRDFLSLVDDQSFLDGISVDLVMSHLACADEAGHTANRAQFEAFRHWRGLMPDAPASLANSSGIFLGADYHFDLARPGAALYGVNPTPGRPNPMRQPVQLFAKVIQTRTLDAGIGVGYGHAFRTTGPFRAATIALGYADGWPRRAGATAYFQGEKLPFAGRVSMDSIILDISSLPDGSLKAGDLVELIGVDQTIDDLAALSGTIGYEILTGLGSRFFRNYVGGDPPGVTA